MGTFSNDAFVDLSLVFACKSDRARIRAAWGASVAVPQRDRHAAMALPLLKHSRFAPALAAALRAVKNVLTWETAVLPPVAAPLLLPAPAETPLAFENLGRFADSRFLLPVPAPEAPALRTRFAPAARMRAAAVAMDAPAAALSFLIAAAAPAQAPAEKRQTLTLRARPAAQEKGERPVLTLKTAAAPGIIPAAAPSMISRRSTATDLAAAFKAEMQVLTQKPEEAAKPAARRQSAPVRKTWTELRAAADEMTRRQAEAPRPDLAAAFKAEMKAMLTAQEKPAMQQPAPLQASFKPRVVAPTATRPATTAARRGLAA